MIFHALLWKVVNQKKNPKIASYYLTVRQNIADSNKGNYNKKRDNACHHNSCQWLIAAKSPVGIQLSKKC